MTQQMLRISITEDDTLYARKLHHLLSQDPEHQVSLYTQARDLLASLAQPAAIYLLDYWLPDGTAAQLLPRILARVPDATVIIVSGQEDVATAAQLLRMGAYDYILKDTDAADKLLTLVQHIKRQQWLEQENLRLQKALHAGKPSDQLVGSSAELAAVWALLDKAAQTDITVGILGETGTGKEVVARLIHRQSKRHTAPFVAINVAAIPTELVESTLFGHEKGAFTGAHSKQVGTLEQANGGTLFLDEICMMQLPMQVKLLRALQERTFYRVGGRQEVQSDFRLITATHQDLLGQVQTGLFRQDLYYRLLGLSISLPPLRHRLSDIPELAHHFVETYAIANQLTPLHISPEALQLLQAHSWPGNVRELRAVMELAVVLASSGIIRPADIRLSAPPQIALGATLPDMDQDLTLAEYQQRIVAHMLQKYGGNVLHVAKVLDVGKSTLYRMLKQYPDLRAS